MNPVLFNLFINNINDIFDECFCHPVTLGNTKLSNLPYADDLFLISELKQACKVAWKTYKHTARSGKLLSIIKRQKSWLWKKDNPSIQIHHFKKVPIEICKLYQKTKVMVVEKTQSFYSSQGLK